MMIRCLGWVVAVLLVAACAPLEQAIGPPWYAPRLEADAAVAADGARLPLRHWEPDPAVWPQPQAVILAVHGFNDYSYAFDRAGRRWAELGMLTYAYDQRGFGGSPQRGVWPGERRLVADLRQVADLLRARHPGTPLYLLGESMGGAVVVLTVTGDTGVRPDGVILVAPALWGRDDLTPVETGGLWLLAHTMPWLPVAADNLGIVPTDNMAVMVAMAQDRLVLKYSRIDTVYGLVGLMDHALAALPQLRVPALLLYGQNEDVLRASSVTRVAEWLPAEFPAVGRVAVYPNGYHMLLRDNEAETVLADVAHWIAQPGTPLPSGADDGRLLADGDGR